MGGNPVKREEVFYVNESPYMPNHYTIGIHHDKFNLTSTVGSYNVIMARILGISYANFLRMCRDSFEAIIIGKNTYYPVAYFKSKTACKSICDLLNSYATIILWDRAHPEFEQHKQELEDFKAGIISIPMVNKDEDK